MKRLVRTVIATAVATAMLQVSALDATAMGGPPDEQTTGLATGLSTLAGYFGGFAATEEFGTPIPGTSLLPGGPAGIDLVTLFGGLSAAVGAPTISHVTDLKVAVDGYDVAGGGATRGVQTSATIVPPPTGSAVYGLDVTLTATRTVAAPLQLRRPAAPGVRAVDLAPVGAGSGLPLEMVWSSSFQVRYDADSDEFWMVVNRAPGAVTPALSLTSTVDGDPVDDAVEPDPPAFAPGTSDVRLGVGTVSITPGSELTLNQVLAIAFADDGSYSGGDGRLAFYEKASDGITMLAAELLLPRNQNTRVDPSGSLSASLNLASALAPAGVTPPAATVTVAATDLAAPPAQLPITTDAAYDQLAVLQNVTSTDLLGGLGQLVLALRAMQTHPSADTPLPFLDAQVSDAVFVGSELSRFIVEHTRADDPATPQNEFGLATFDTVEKMVAELKSSLSVPSLVDAELVPVFLPASGGVAPELTYRLHLGRALDVTDQGFTASVFTATDGTPVPKGVPSLGSQLRTDTTLPAAMTGLANLTTTAPPAATKRTGYEIDVVTGVNLRDAVPCNPACDDPTTPVVESDDLPVYKRFFLQVKAGPELVLTAVAKSTVTATKGRAGFAEVEVVAPSTVEATRPDASKPTLSEDLDLGPTGRRPLDEVLTLFADDAPVGLTVVRNIGGAAALKVQAFGDGGHSYLTAPATIGVIWPNALQPLKTADVTLDENARLLKALDFNVGSADALAGRFLNTLDSVAGDLKGLAGLATGDAANTALPLVNTAPSQLFSQWDTLRTKVDEIRAGAQPPSLRELEIALQSKLGLLPGDIELDLRNFPSGTGQEPNLVVRLDHDRTLDGTKLPLAFNLSGLGNVVGLGAEGTLTLDGDSAVDLGVPIPLTTAEPSDLYVLDTSKLHLDAQVNGGPGVALKATLGGLQVSLGDTGKGAAGEGAIKANAAYDLAKPGVNASDPQRVKVADFAGSLKSTFSSTDVTCQPPDPDGPANLNNNTGLKPQTSPITGQIACLSMPVFVNGDPFVATEEGPGSSNYLKVKLDDGFALSGTPPTGLDPAYLATIALDFGPISEGLSKLGELVAGALKTASFNGKLPLVGDKLAGAADVAAELNTVSALAWAKKIEAATTPTVADVRTGVLDPLADEMVNLGIVVDSDAPFNGDAGNDPSRNDVKFSLYCGGTTVCTEGQGAQDISDVTVETTFGRGTFGATPAEGGDCADGDPCSGPLAVDLGVPAINLKISGSGVSAKTGWRANVGFGVSRTEGFYLLENPLPSTGIPDAGDVKPELSVGLSASLPSDLSAEATLGFLKVTATESGVNGTPGVSGNGFAQDDDPGNHNSTVGIQAGLNLRRPGGAAGANDERIVGAELLGLLTRIPDAWSLRIDGAADIDLHLAVSVDGLAQGLPGIASDFLLDWEFTVDTAAGKTFKTSVPTIAFNNVGIDPGSILTGTLKTIITDIRSYTKPIDPVREFLFSPVPVISDLAVEFGQQPVTYFDLVEASGSGDYQLLRDINTLLDLIAQFADPLAAGAHPIILLGSFTVLGAKASGPPAAVGAAASLIEGLPDLSDAASAGEQAADGTYALPGVLDDVLNAATTKIKDTLQKAADDAGIDPEPDFTFPIFEKPDCIFGMLLGSDCEVVRWKPDGLVARFDFNQKYGPFFGVLYVTLAGSASAKANLSVGYDTKGIRELLEGTKTTGVALIDGLFVDDVNKLGVDIPEVELKGSIVAGGEIGIFIAGAGVRGGLTATVDLNLRDGPDLDGKLRVDEIGARLATNFLCVFDISGALEAFLEVYAYFGVCPFCDEETYTLATIKLLDFTELNPDDCDPKPPILATEGQGLGGPEGGTLRLNMGEAFASARGPGWDDTKESFTVTQHPDGKLSVQAFGYVQTYSGSKVVFDAGSDIDSVSFVGSQANSIPEDGPTTGATYDDPKPGAVPVFNLPVFGKLGAGNDSATTGEGNDVIFGEIGDDRISLGGGNDRAGGGPGDDTINGGAGDDPRLVGGPGNDVIDGGLGRDGIDGGDGNDRIFGGRDVQTAAGLVQDGPDVILGGFDDDTIDAGSGDDIVYGDFGTYASDIATPNGATGVTDNVGASARGDGAGIVDPTPDAFTEDDEIHGGAGADTVYAGPGQDDGRDTETLCGDFVDGGDGADVVHGQGGPDCIFGANGDDDLFGGPGADRISGGDGDDDLFGQADPDLLGGDNGNDYADGGPGADTIFGGPDDDSLVGGADGDAIYGEDGADYVAGDVATITGSGVARAFTGVGVDSVGDAAGAGDDTVEGGAGPDMINGQGGTDTLRGGLGADVVNGNGGADHVFGDDGDDVLRGNAGDDDVHGGPGADLASGDAGSDSVFGDTGDDRLTGGAHTVNAVADAGDFVYGGNGNDVMLGDNGTIGTDAPRTVVLADPNAAATTYGGDLLDGGDGEDVGHGQGGSDTLYGGAGDDRLLGELDGDVIHGQSGHDHLLGDQGTLVAPTTGPATYPEGGKRWTVSLTEPDRGGKDTITGGTGDDHAYGGADDDIVSGDTGDDHLEGNGGQDSVYGLDSDVSLADVVLATSEGDQDDILGGSSDVNPLAVKSDIGELILRGGPDADVLTGDNAIVTRTPNDDNTAYTLDPNGFGVARSVELLDTLKAPDALALVSGGDLILGDDGRDRAFGEGGPDTVKGGNQDDIVLGNQGGDLLEGNDGEDDLVGGSALLGEFDGGDVLHGGAGADAGIGDNGLILRGAAQPGDPVTERTTAALGVGTTRRIAFFDIATTSAATLTSGSDVLSGGQGADALFGQDKRDYLLGGSEDDNLEGMGGSDFVFGDRIPSDVEGVGAPAELAAAGGLPGAPLGTPGARSAEPDLSGVQGADGQDDMLGGTTKVGALDAGDFLYGGGAADHQLGDNGKITRRVTGTAYDLVPNYDGSILRQVERYDVADPAGTSGGDLMYGEGGNDRMWGQDGDDVQYGGDGDDDMLGELGADRMFGEAGEDAMVGDRGSIRDTLLSGSPGSCAATASVQGPTFLTYAGLCGGMKERRVSLTNDYQLLNFPSLTKPGTTDGGADFMRGGPDHDSMHGAAGDDLMNGDSGGDWLLGDNGADKMWGGKGSDDPNNPNDRGVNDSLVDILLGGESGLTVLTSDFLDYRPRPGDATAWFEITDTLNDFGAADAVNNPTVADNQHNNGIDLIYGGSGRDVLQGNVGKNGPDQGDRLVDWTGAFNLYTRCNASYGDDGDVRQITPQLQLFMETVAYGIGAGESLASVRTAGTSGAVELALVKGGDKLASGKAFPTTPGNFEKPSCVP